MGMDSDEYKLLALINKDVAVIKNEITHLPTTEDFTNFKIEFATFKTRVMTIGTCLVFASGAIGYALNLFLGQG